MARLNDPEYFPKLRFSALLIKAAALASENKEIERISVHAYRSKSHPLVKYALVIVVRWYDEDSPFQYFMEEIPAIIDKDIYYDEHYSLGVDANIDLEWLPLLLLPDEDLPKGALSEPNWTLFPQLEPITFDVSETGGQEGHLTQIPKPASWGDVTKRFKDGHIVSISINRTEFQNEIFTYTELSFKDGRTGNTTESWKLLELFAQNRGVLQWDTRGADMKLKKQKSVLSKKLMTLFGLDTSPFFNYRKEGCYRSRFLVSYS